MRKLATKLLGRFGFVPKSSARGYALGQTNRLTADWASSGADANKELRGDIRLMRERARELERNNDYVRRYFKLLENNVLGSNGIGLQMKIREVVRRGTKFVEQYDARANRMIEAAWAEWGKRQFCTIGGDHTWLDVQRLALRSVARDGAVLLRKHVVPPFGLALELIEIDQLDHDKNEMVGNNSVRLGVEYSPQGRVVAYHLFKQHPGSVGGWNYQIPDRDRASADEIIHLYHPERIGQSSGAPWIHSAGAQLKQLGAYVEAETIAARAAACKGGWFRKTGSQGYVGEADSAGNPQMEMSPGVWEVLPVGLEPVPFDPSHPSTAFGLFVKSALRGIAAGLGVSYVSLANDLEGVNYSSIRAGLLDEREEWKAVQRWFVEWFITPVFDFWLENSLALGAIEDNGQVLPANKFDKFNSPEWKPRRWDWVDPLKDQQANVLSVEKGFKSRRQIISENGGDIEDVLQDIAADKALEKEYGLDFSSSDEVANAQQETPDKPDSVDKKE